MVESVKFDGGSGREKKAKNRYFAGFSGFFGSSSNLKNFKLKKVLYFYTFIRLSGWYNIV